jgi:hypothetical protein
MAEHASLFRPTPKHTAAVFGSTNFCLISSILHALHYFCFKFGVSEAEMIGMFGAEFWMIY